MKGAVHDTGKYNGFSGDNNCYLEYRNNSDLRLGEIQANCRIEGNLAAYTYLVDDDYHIYDRYLIGSRDLTGIFRLIKLSCTQGIPFPDSNPERGSANIIMCLFDNTNAVFINRKW